jgi:hypothetical protein
MCGGLRYFFISRICAPFPTPSHDAPTRGTTQTTPHARHATDAAWALLLPINANLPPGMRLSCRPHVETRSAARPAGTAGCVERTSDMRDRTSAWTTLRLTIRIASSRSAHVQPFATCQECMR